VRGVVDQRATLVVQLHPEVGTENRACARADGRTHRWIGVLESRDNGSIDTDGHGDRALRYAGAETQLPEVLGESERRAPQLTIASLDGQAANATSRDARHSSLRPAVAGGAHRTTDRPYPSVIWPRCLRYP
jgi:hypothetical protein